MIGAGDPRVSAIAATLGKCSSRIEPSGHTCWTFALSNGTDLQGMARLDGGWLLLSALLPESRVTYHESRLWRLLQWNRMLPGGAKFAVLPTGPGVHVRAEVPLDDEVNLCRRIAQAYTGIKTASTRLWSPLPPGEDDRAPNTQFVECDDGADLAGLCRETEWTFVERSGKLVIELDVPGSFQQAVVEVETQRGVAVLVDVATSSGPLAMPCRQALALLLLRTCAVVRMVRAVVEDTGSATAARFEVLFGDTPCGAELAHAFSALSVACRIAGREAAILQRDEIIAREYLKTRCPSLHPRPLGEPVLIPVEGDRSKGLHDVSRVDH
jgi:hypothetical protein